MSNANLPPNANPLGRWVEIEFDCMPLRNVTRVDVPLDASPKYEQFVLRVKAALAKHGTLNSYYLHRGRCVLHLTNDANRGSVSFSLEGTVLTDETDTKTRHVDVAVTLGNETCSWLNEPAVEFLIESVRHAIAVEFDRYIAAGDLNQTKARLDALEQQLETGNAFQAMYL